MVTAIATDEAQRLEALRRYGILDTEPEEAFDSLAILAARVCDATASILCFVDDTRSWTKAGLNNAMLEVPRERSVAAQVVDSGEPLVICDTHRASPEIQGLDAVARYGVRFFAAVPLVTPEAHAIGAMGVFDHEPRQLSDDQLDALQRLAQQVVARLELRRQARELEAAKGALEVELAQRRAAEAALWTSEGRFRTLVEHGSDVIAVIDSSGVLTFVSASVQRILGYAPDDLLGANVFAFIHPDDVAAVRSVFQDRLREPGVGEPTALRFRAHDGSWRHFEAAGTNPGHDAELAGLIVVARDVTARVRAEEALRRREAILAAVSVFAEQLLRSPSWESGIGEALQALGEAAGVTRVYVCERRRRSDQTEWLVVNHDWVAPGHSRRGRQAMRRGVPLERVGLGRWADMLQAGEAIRGRLSDFVGRERTVLRALAIRSVAIVPVTIDGEWWGFIGFGECRREREWSPAEIDALRAAGNTLGAAIHRQRVAERLERTVRQLARSNAELEQFAYVASHDLQEPLRMVQSYLELLQRRYEGRLEASAEEFIAIAMDGAERMRQLIHDLLAISRIDTRASQRVPTDTGELLDRVLRDIGEALRESRAEVIRGELPVVMADSTQLAQVFQNLLSNAVKFRGEAPCRVWVGATRQDGEWLFSVRDHGIGLDPRHAQRIFVAFQRLHSRREYPGTGIGLALCKKIIERHGGRIWVESEPGKGAEFHFTIPDALDSDSNPAQPGDQGS
jgi:PAS domain S-box-containing protein